ncbi:MAG: DUF1957 domain-containing protein [Deltaproteobacteria bacterium]|nr:DUF1957 domain-containing protein [Deltaproteobacteria bacterium]
MSAEDQDSWLFPRMRKDQLLTFARKHGLLGLEGLDRIALIDLLRRFLIRSVQRLRVGLPLLRRQKSPVGVGHPTPAFKLDERLVLLVRDSRTLYVYWNVAKGALEASLSRGERLRLRLLDVVDVEGRSEVAATVEVPLPAWARDYHLPLPRGARDYRVEVGSVQVDGSWRALLCSNVVSAPHEGPSGDQTQQLETITAESDLREFQPQSALTSPPPPGPSLFFHPADELPQLVGEVDAQGAYAPPGRAISPLAVAEGDVQVAVPFKLPHGYGPTSEQALGEEPLFAWHHLADGEPVAVALGPTFSSAETLGVSSSACAGRVASGSLEVELSPAANQANQAGSLAMVLHAHLPFVRHPELDLSLEEGWLFEALCETYLPLLDALWRLRDEGCDYTLTLALSPPLLAMWCDESLQQRFEQHLAGRLALLSREQTRTAGDQGLQEVLAHYAEQLGRVEEIWRTLDGDISGAFAALQTQGYLELMTCAATHAHLPLLSSDDARWAQISIAVEQHQRFFGVAPRGIWLPECAYEKGIDVLLARAGLRHFVLESHAIEHARPQPEAGTSRPIFCAESGVAAFGRDPQAAEQVWSRESGYPGDPVYRDFYRDIGFDLPREALGPLVPEDGPRRFTGFKYHRITGGAERKAIYHPLVAAQRARQHAQHFLAARQQQLQGGDHQANLVVAPYDAELFGHWWHEGVTWLEEVLRQASTTRHAPQLVTLAGYLNAHPTQHVAQPSGSSWGEGGYHAYWLHESNRWIYPELHQATDRLVAALRHLMACDGPELMQERAAAQATRELLLAQASDWAFMMRADSAADYARRRVRQHLDQTNALCQDLEQGTIDVTRLEVLESRDNLFPDLDWRALAQGNAAQGNAAL